MDTAATVRCRHRFYCASHSRIRRDAAWPVGERWHDRHRGLGFGIGHRFRDDGFAVDADGAFAVVQGFAWFPKEPLRRALVSSGLAVDMAEVLRLYSIMMSSDVFFRVCREYSTSAAGGQIALQQKYLNNVPIPLLPTVMRDRPHLIDEMAHWTSDFPELEQRNRFAAMCYGFDRAY